VLLKGFHFNAFYVLSWPQYKLLVEKKIDLEKIDALNAAIAHYFCSDQDISAIKAMGANVVRIKMDLWNIEKSPFVYSAESLRHLDQLIEHFGRQGVYVILSLHAAGQNAFPINDVYGHVLWKDEQMQKRVVAFWQALAKRYRDNVFIAGFDVLNEPQPWQEKDEPLDKMRAHLFQYYEKIVSAVRLHDQRRIVILEFGLDRQQRDILVGGVTSDKNIMTSLHFYLPRVFTKQGLGGFATGQRYPGEYKKEWWDKNKLKETLLSDLKSVEVTKHPFYVGEFGASIQDAQTKKDAYQWTRDIIDIMRDANVHWTYFCYKTAFMPSRALCEPDSQAASFIQNTVNALAREPQQDIQSLVDKNKGSLSSDHFHCDAQLSDILIEAFK